MNGSPVSIPITEVSNCMIYSNPCADSFSVLRVLQSDFPAACTPLFMGSSFKFFMKGISAGVTIGKAINRTSVRTRMGKKGGWNVKSIHSMWRPGLMRSHLLFLAVSAEFNKAWDDQKKGRFQTSLHSAWITWVRLFQCSVTVGIISYDISFYIRFIKC